MASINGCTPFFLRAEPHRTGTNSILHVNRRTTRRTARSRSRAEHTAKPRASIASRTFGASALHAPFAPASSAIHASSYGGSGAVAHVARGVRRVPVRRRRRRERRPRRGRRRDGLGHGARRGRPRARRDRDEYGGYGERGAGRQAGGPKLPTRSMPRDPSKMRAIRPRPRRIAVATGFFARVVLLAAMAIGGSIGRSFATTRTRFRRWSSPRRARRPVAGRRRTHRSARFGTRLCTMTSLRDSSTSSTPRSRTACAGPTRPVVRAVEDVDVRLPGPAPTIEQRDGSSTSPLLLRASRTSPRRGTASGTTRSPAPTR